MELSDLKEIGSLAQQKYRSDYAFSEFAPSEAFLEQFKTKYEDMHSGAQFIAGKHSAAIITSTGNTIDFPYSLFLRVSYFLDFAKAYGEYALIVNQIIQSNLQNLTAGYGSSELQLRTGLFEILKETRPAIGGDIASIVSSWKESLSEKEYIYTNFLGPLYQQVKERDIGEIENMFRFLSDNEWSYTGKSPLRLDGIGSAIMSLMSVVQVKQGVIPDLVAVLISESTIFDLAQKDAKNISTVAVAPVAAFSSFKGENLIYYGAPGTGKSHAINKLVYDDNAIRAVFHTDTQNSDFVGCIKPVMDDGEISYRFRPGPFTVSIVHALKAPDQPHWLVIEEINRAPAASVFGEIFQLLDRDSSGESKYQIDFTDPDMLAYINDELTGSGLRCIEKLSIPANLTLLATMNSTDQAVMPMDTAFKRRWKFKYVPLDFDHDCATGTLPIPTSSGTVFDIEWRDFAVAINSVLSENGIPEDRHLGQFFLDNEELAADAEERQQVLTGKLFMYLWDDVLRHVNRDTIFNPIIKTYGQLNQMYMNNEDVFSEGFRNRLPKVYMVSTEESTDFLEVAEPKIDE